MQSISFSLADIAGLSAFNARQGAADPQALDELAESIATTGLHEPLTLRREGFSLNVLDGGRRWTALKLLWERERISETTAFHGRLFEGDDHAAAQYSLSTFLLREGLSPVDEFERLVAHAEAFALDAAGVAREFGKSERWARDRLRLARLSAKVREVWRKKRLTLEQARALAITDDHAAQDALIDQELQGASPDGASPLDLPVHYIRRQLSGARVAATDKLAIFVTREAYLAAGGALDEQLFADEDTFEDGALLKRLASEKLSALVAEIRKAEKWGHGWHCLESDFATHRWVFDARHDYTEEEQERLDAIDAALEAENAGAVGLAQSDGEKAAKSARPVAPGQSEGEVIARLEIERFELERKALLRAIGVKERKTLGVRIAIGHDGAPEIDRAVKLQTPSERAPAESPSPLAGEGSERSEPGEGDEGEADSAKDAPGEPAQPLAARPKDILDAAASQALSGACARHPDLALVFAVAALGCRYGVQGITLPAHATRADFEPKSPLLRSISGDAFPQALLKVLRARLGAAEFREEDDACAVLTAFAELIGGCMNPKSATNFDVTRLLLAAASRFGASDAALAEALDYEAWFDAAGKEGALAAAEELGGDVKALKKLKAPAVKEAAVRLARDKAWLPKYLRLEDVSLEPRERLGPAQSERAGMDREPPGSHDNRTLAQAMADAIEADEASE